mmetsp:Transcript_20796/g.61500  ORF Transcript_20796/g.61500 Transcript_20796/m.61500 type:complete len:225 (+) Transcript_20796:416-1090(+)
MPWTAPAWTCSPRRPPCKSRMLCARRACSDPSCTSATTARQTTSSRECGARSPRAWRSSLETPPAPWHLPPWSGQAHWYRALRQTTRCWRSASRTLRTRRCQSWSPCASCLLVGMRAREGTSRRSWTQPVQRATRHACTPPSFSGTQSSCAACSWTSCGQPLTRNWQLRPHQRRQAERDSSSPAGHPTLRSSGDVVNGAPATARTPPLSRRGSTRRTRCTTPRG